MADSCALSPDFMASIIAFTASSGEAYVTCFAFAVAAGKSEAKKAVATAKTSARISGRSRALSERDLGDVIVPNLRILSRFGLRLPVPVILPAATTASSATAASSTTAAPTAGPAAGPAPGAGSTSATPAHAPAIACGPVLAAAAPAAEGVLAPAPARAAPIHCSRLSGRLTPPVHGPCLPAPARPVAVPARLPAGRGLPPAPLAVLLRGRVVPVGDALPVTGVVLPFPRTALAPLPFPLVFSAVDVLVDVRVPVIVDVHVAPVPVAIPPRVPPRRPDRDPGGEGKGGRAVRVGVDGVWRVGGVCPRAVHHRGVVRRHVDDLRAGLLDDDDLRILLDHHLLLLRRLQVPGIVRLLPELLDGVQHVLLLREERVPDLLRPVELVGHHLEDLGEVHERLDARVPLLLLERLRQRVALELLVLLHPVVGLHDLQGIGGRHQELGQEVVRVERYRRQQLVQLLLGEGLPLRLGLRLPGFLREDSSRQEKERHQGNAHPSGEPSVGLHRSSCGSVSWAG